MSAWSVLAAVVGGLALGAGLTGPANGPTARIEVTRGPIYEASAVIDGNAGTSGTYTFTIIREGLSGRSRSRQGGAFELISSTDTLSTSRVNVSHGDSIEMELMVEWADGSTDTDVFSETIE